MPAFDEARHGSLYTQECSTHKSELEGERVETNAEAVLRLLPATDPHGDVGEEQWCLKCRTFTGS